METGDYAPNVIPGDLESNLIRMLHREEIEAGGPMPPTKALKPELIEIFERRVLGGAPNTIQEAAEVSGSQQEGDSSETPVLTPTVTP